MIRKIIQFLTYPWVKRRKRKKEFERLLKLAGLKLIKKANTSVTLCCMASAKKSDGTFKIVDRDDNSIIYDDNLTEKEAINKIAEHTMNAKKKYPNLSDDDAIKIYLNDLYKSFKLDEFYEKGYNYRKPLLPKLQEIEKIFGKHGVKLYNEVTRKVRRYRNTLERSELKNRVLASGVTSKKYIKEVIIHTNFPNKKLNTFLRDNKINRLTATLDDIKSIYKHMLKEGHIKYDLHPFIEQRLKVHFEKLGQFHNGIKHTNYNWRQTGGLPGIHAEILSLNELLWKIQAKGYPVTDDILKEIIGFNRNFKYNDVMIRCGDCNFLTRGIAFIEKFKN